LAGADARAPGGAGPPHDRGAGQAPGGGPRRGGLSRPFIDWFAEEGRRVYGDVIPSQHADKRILTFKQPVGMCAFITPWNSPLAMLAREAGAALAAGCALSGQAGEGDAPERVYEKLCSIIIPAMNRPYPRDLTDQHWLIIEPLLPSAKSGGRRRSVELRVVVNGIFIFHFRLGARYTVTIDPGAATASGRRSTMPCVSRCANTRAEPRNPVPGSLTVRQSRPQKKGTLWV